MATVLEVAATLFAGLFAGAACYILFVEHPARLEGGNAFGLTEFVLSYQRAAVMQPLLAFLSFLTAAAAWHAGSGFGWLAGGVAMGSLFPFTIILMLPINNRLNDPSLHRDSPEAGELLDRWGSLHRVRCLMSLAAFGLFLILLRSA